MRGLTLALALLLLSTAGCLGPPTVRVALVTESFAFDEDAPAEAAAALDMRGCPGTYDPETGTLRLVRLSETTPTFVMLMHRAPDSRGPAGLPDPGAGRYTPMSAGAGGGFFGIEAVERWMSQRGSSGSWGHGPPYHGERHVDLEWDRDGARFEGEPLRAGAFVNETLVHEVTQYNATFHVTQTFSATYLGRLPYAFVASCEPT